MSKSNYPKWFNPTGDSMWDNYYKAWWIVLFPLLVIAIIALVMRFKP